MTQEEKLAEIIDVIDTIKIYIQQDGGDVEFVSYQDDTVTLKLLGACIGCNMIDITYQQGLQEILRDEVDPKIKVELIEEPTDLESFIKQNL